MKPFLFSLIVFLAINVSVQEMKIRINQCGYYPAASKIDIVVNAEENSEFELNTPLGESVFTGKLSEK